MPAPVRSLPPPSKKRKSQDASVDAAAISSIQALEAALTDAVRARGSLNPLADLLDVARGAADAQLMSKAIYALYRVFVLVIAGGRLAGGGDAEAKVVRTWIWERLGGYVDLLCGLLKDEEKALRLSALQILFSLQKHLSTSLTAGSAPAEGSSTTKNTPQFHASHFKKIVSALLVCPPSARRTSSSKRAKRETSPDDASDGGKLDLDVRELFVETWLTVHDDVRWFFLREAATLLPQHPAKAHPHLAENLLSILERLNTFPTDPAELNAWWVEELGAKPPKAKAAKAAADEDEDDEAGAEPTQGADDDWRTFFDDPTSKDKDSAGADGKAKAKRPAARLHQMTLHQSLHALPSHRAVFTRAWLTLLPRLEEGGRTERASALSVRALNVMHRGVMPHLTRPVFVMDWVAGCVDYGGTVGLLALNALFILMTEYNLDYPSFYTRLYAFLDRDVLHLRHRARFFRMTELFLTSTHLPATLLASFVKRLSRLSLNAPPAAVVMIVPFTYNILKRHPALMCMIHRPDTENFSDEKDPFLPEEPNPNLTHALESSLWELVSSRRHYHAPAATLARIFEAPFTKPNYATEDFLDHTYATMFETEVKKKMRKEPAVETDLGRDLFPTVGGAGDEEALAARDVVADLWDFGAA